MSCLWLLIVYSVAESDIEEVSLFARASQMYSIVYAWGDFSIGYIILYDIGKI